MTKFPIFLFYLDNINFFTYGELITLLSYIQFINYFLLIYIFAGLLSFGGLERRVLLSNLFHLPYKLITGPTFDSVLYFTLRGGNTSEDIDKDKDKYKYKDKDKDTANKDSNKDTNPNTTNNTSKKTNKLSESTITISSNTNMNINTNTKTKTTYKTHNIFNNLFFQSLNKLSNIKNYFSIMYKKYFYNNKNPSAKINIRQSFLFILILDKLNINIPENASAHVNFAFGIFILSLICLLSFINVVGYLTSIYLINIYDIEQKFPKLKTIVRYFERSSLVMIVLEGLTCVIFLICIIVFSLIEVGYPIFK